LLRATSGIAYLLSLLTKDMNVLSGSSTIFGTYFFSCFLCDYVLIQ